MYKGKKNIDYSHYDFASVLSYTRYIFKRIESPSIEIVGTMLLGETQFHPEEVYKLYSRVIYSKSPEKDRKFNSITGVYLIPNEDCLASLLTCSLKIKKLDKEIPDSSEHKCYDAETGYLMWEDKYAVQVAISEFKKWVRFSNLKEEDENAESESIQNSFDDYVLPSNELWILYIKVLFKYNYLDHLSDILRWWERLSFNPNKRCLLHLMASLPEDVANVLRKHAESNLKEAVAGDVPDSADEHISYETCKDDFRFTNWPWPTEFELQDFRIDYVSTMKNKQAVEDAL
ncbi:uncharacterized protein ASCRUDRAFT_73384 [Ascoidea rubescens DSM 1968]|uniref:Uncharacterized protein n=1 Tax=Ascoidea rubescens DSM 1968 TaxID=1344418 RepID=A0A1D2VPS9_9ASCO|nr:hypothetical protein ASCRUDRAFT_73384 [Ascoidea rubescens DSM 1968]ODV63557.1 hypothetical protein ASCRUDRAFT_73384 [Ascoidea rubescens DSM 1968]